MCGIALTLAWQQQPPHAHTAVTAPSPTTPHLSTTAANTPPPPRPKHDTPDAIVLPHLPLTCSSSVESVAWRWGGVAARCLQPRGPDVQQSLRVTLPQRTRTEESDETVVQTAAVITGTVLHLRGAALTPTPQPLVDAATGHALCWNGELYSLDFARLPPQLRRMDLPQIQPGQNDTQALPDGACAAASTSASITGVAFSSQPQRDATPPHCDFGTLLSWLLAAMDGPFSFVFARRGSGTEGAHARQVWYGRDRIGRRSLLTALRHEGGSEGDQRSQVCVLHVTSVAFPDSELRCSASGTDTGMPCDTHEGTPAATEWSEVAPSGPFCIDFSAPSAAALGSTRIDCEDTPAPFTLLHYPYPHLHAALGLQSGSANPTAAEGPLVSISLPAASFSAGGEARLDRGVAPYERPTYTAEGVDSEQAQQQRMVSAAAALSLPPALAALPPASQLLYFALHQSMRHRVGRLCAPASSTHARVGVLFSGGLDCTVLAMMAHETLCQSTNSLPDEPIDLISVAFCGELRRSAISRLVPDRVTALQAWGELRRATLATGSKRQWRLVLVDVSLKMMQRHRARITALLRPSHTVMDFNIASVLWFGARAKGRLCTEEKARMYTEETTADAHVSDTKLDTSPLSSPDGVAADTSAPHTPASDASAASASPTTGSAAASLAKIHSRLARMGQTHTPTGGAASDAAAAASVAKSKKGRELPPELVARIAAAAPTPSFLHRQAKQAAAAAWLAATAAVTPADGAARSDADGAVESERSTVLCDDVSVSVPASSLAPGDVSATGADGVDVDSAAASAPSLRLTKAERRTLKNRERNLIRKYFKNQASEAVRQDMEEMRPAEADFMPEGGPAGPEDRDPTDDEEADGDTQSATETSSSSGWYTSAARVLLLGIGADELMAGYGRHRTAWISAGGNANGGNSKRQGGARNNNAQRGQPRQQEAVPNSAVISDTTAAAASVPSPIDTVAGVSPAVTGSDESSARDVAHEEGASAPSPVADPGAAPGSASAAASRAASSAASPSAAASASASRAASSASPSDALRASLASDFTRLWRRNLGRDDRVIGDSGREARHPYLCEGVLHTLHSLIPLSCVADLAAPAGVGDKRVLRQLAAALGIPRSGQLVKRAMQFGSRIASKAVPGTTLMTDDLPLTGLVNPLFLRASLTHTQHTYTDAQQQQKMTRERRGRVNVPASEAQPSAHVAM